MKLLPSPSISSSSTTTTTASFDPNVCTSESATTSCLAGILRRILCSRSLPTHPSDQITETSSLVCDNKQSEFIKSSEKLEATATATPGIVARLMGLEFFPETPGSILRSRSMNSVEFRGETDQMQGQHRRVKSTLSFREMPTFVELENEEFFVLSFEDVGSESQKARSKQRKGELGFGESKQKKREKCNRVKILLDANKNEEKINKMVLRVLNEAELSNRNAEDKPTQEIGNCGKIEVSPNLSLNDSCENFSIEDAKRYNWMRHKEVSDRAQLRKKKKKKIKNRALENKETESSSQDSSPVSVLDFDQFIIDPEVTTSEEDAKSGESNSRRKLSPQLDKHNYNQLSQCGDNSLIGDGRNSKKSADTSPGCWKKVCHNQDYLNMWSEICRLAETQLVETDWDAHKNLCKFEEDFEGISADFGLQILDQLLQELVDQLG